MENFTKRKLEITPILQKFENEEEQQAPGTPLKPAKKKKITCLLGVEKLKIENKKKINKTHLTH